MKPKNQSHLTVDYHIKLIDTDYQSYLIVNYHPRLSIV